MATKWLHPVYGGVRLLADAYYRALARLKRKGTARLYVFTDSRGFRADLWYCKKNPIRSYVHDLATRYRTEYSISRYSPTTLIDFLYDVRKLDLCEVDFIILHAGIVDFSPRPLNQAKEILGAKARRIESLFGKEALRDFPPRLYEEEYEGEQTASLYGIEVLKKHILPAIDSLPKPVIWIGVNPVLADWVGNYRRERPKNMNSILEYQEIIDRLFKGTKIGLRSWERTQIIEDTIDNIHFTQAGFQYLARSISQCVDQGKVT
ncbi:conserved protein of unknown function [Georgfuchsia toluolica]|uniref:Uncharacterized protein n=1 Tax=Georgfuchsia toluolica TaxID=424218 RepID=A0A916N2W9_9PROT|nr:hypothetical protein [Georgfuchsia toluolica]CAG4884364.1 conserved protein of unknown function [Georgfuchsia toluolica]